METQVKALAKKSKLNAEAVIGLTMLLTAAIVKTVTGEKEKQAEETIEETGPAPVELPKTEDVHMTSHLFNRIAA